MTFVRHIDSNDDEKNVNKSFMDKLRSFRSSLSDTGWNLDSVVHLLLFVPFAVATIFTLSAMDWSALIVA